MKSLPYARESNTASLIVWIPRHGFRISGTGFRIICHWNLDTGFQSLVRLRIPYAVFRNPKPRIPNSTRKNFPDSEIRIPLHGVNENLSVCWPCFRRLPAVSLFVRFSEGSARAGERQETQEMRAVARKEKWTSFVSRLQSRAWSFACLARFDRWNKKKGRLLVVYCFRDAGIIWEPSKGYPIGGKKKF